MKLRETFQRSAREMSHKGIWYKACSMERDGDQVDVLAPLFRSCEVSEPFLMPLYQKDGSRPHTQALQSLHEAMCAAHLALNKCYCHPSILTVTTAKNIFLNSKSRAFISASCCLDIISLFPFFSS